MSDIKHTPGPWTVNPLDADWESNTIFASTLANGTRRLVATVSVGSDAPSNRRLIAAAPELLEAVEAMLEWDAREEDHKVDFRERLALCAAAFDKARAAYAKATGSQS